MKTRLIHIGNSIAVRIPKRLLEQTGLQGNVEIQARGSTLIIGPYVRPRAGWANACREMRRRGDDQLLDDVPSCTQWDDQEWEW